MLYNYAIIIIKLCFKIMNKVIFIIDFDAFKEKEMMKILVYFCDNR